jgi:hypothetical protein
MTESNPTIAAAREFLRTDTGHDVTVRPRPSLEAYAAMLRRHLAQVLAAIADAPPAVPVLPAEAARAAALAQAMTADPVLTPPGEPAWTVEDVLSAAAGRGLQAMEAQYLGGEA